MNSFFKLAILVSFSSVIFSQAQCVKVVNAEHKIMIGGREEARQETLNVTIKDNKKLEPLYFLVNDKKVDFTKSVSNDNISLSAVLMSAQDNFPTVGNSNPQVNKAFDASKVFLVFKNVKNSKLLQKKIKIKESTSNVNQRITTEDLPQ